MGEIIIRKALPSDLEAVVQIEKECFPLAEAADRNSLRERLEVFQNSFLVAEKEGELVGFINGAVTDQRLIEDEMFEDSSFHKPDGTYQSIFGLDVLEQYRHQGIASLLMEAMIDEARRSGRKGLTLTCKDRLIGFYERFGYQNLGVSQSIHGGARWYDMVLEF